MSLMDQLEEIANALNDSNAQWWPFLFLRPRKEQRLTSLRVGLLAVLYGSFVGTLGNLLLLLLGKQLHPLALPFVATAGCFVLYRVVFATFWNRRAARLSRSALNRGRWGQR